MNGYLLDTSICVFLFRGNKKVAEHLSLVNPEKCYVSDVTVAELVFGVENSDNVAYNMNILNHFLEDVQIVPFRTSIHLFAKEKVRLRKLGTPIEDFDLLIAATAVSNHLIMVTDNTKHFKRVKNITLENWKE